MRTLRFIVDGQDITQDPKCDFSGLIPGSQGYLRASFSFSKEWESCVKVAAFFSNLGVEYEPQQIKYDGTCMIPVKALEKSIFKVKIIGQRGNYRLETNKVVVHQRGGNE